MAKVKIRRQEGYDFLWIDGELWMWDIPHEQQAQKSLSDKCYGDVLVAGYGLAILQKFLIQNPNVKNVTTVEVLPEILKVLEKRHGMLYGDVFVEDFYALNTDLKYDFVIGDVWKDIAPEALTDYNKFVAQAQKFVKPGGQILAWGQEFFEALNNQPKSSQQ